MRIHVKYGLLLRVTMILLTVFLADMVFTSCGDGTAGTGEEATSNSEVVKFNPNEENSQYSLYDFADWPDDAKTGVLLKSVTVKVTDASRDDIQIQIAVPKITNEKINYMMEEYGYRAVLILADSDAVLSTPCVAFFRDSELAGNLYLTKTYITPDDQKTGNWVMDIGADNLSEVAPIDEEAAGFEVTIPDNWEEMTINMMKLDTYDEEPQGTGSSTIEPEIVDTYSTQATNDEGYKLDMSITIYKDIINPNQFIRHPGNGELIDIPSGEGKAHVIPFTFSVKNLTEGYGITGLRRSFLLIVGDRDDFCSDHRFAIWNSSVGEWEDMTKGNQYRLDAYTVRTNDYIESMEGSTANGFIYIREVTTPNNPDGIGADDWPPIHLIYKAVDEIDGPTYENDEIDLYVYKNNDGELVFGKEKPQ